MQHRSRKQPARSEPARGAAVLLSNFLGTAAAHSAPKTPKTPRGETFPILVTLRRMTGDAVARAVPVPAHVVRLETRSTGLTDPQSEGRVGHRPYCAHSSGGCSRDCAFALRTGRRDGDVDRAIPTRSRTGSLGSRAQP